MAAIDLGPKRHSSQLQLQRKDTHKQPSPLAKSAEMRLEADIRSPSESPTKSSSKSDRSSLAYKLKTLVAGGIAGTAAKTVIAPLDRVKILFQTSHSNYLPFHGSLLGFQKALVKVYRSEGGGGWLALFKGHSATILRIFPYAGIKFMVYEQVRPEGAETSKFWAGSLAGCVAVVCTYPFDVLRVRMAFDGGGYVRCVAL